jgi:hypothetical protein
VDNFVSSTRAYEIKFPAKVYFSLADTVSAALTTTTDMTGTLGVPLIRRTATGTEFYMAPVISSSTMPRAIGNSNSTLVRNGLIWLGFINSALIIIFTILTL